MGWPNPAAQPVFFTTTRMFTLWNTPERTEGGAQRPPGTPGGKARMRPARAADLFSRNIHVAGRPQNMASIFRQASKHGVYF